MGFSLTGSLNVSGDTVLGNAGTDTVSVAGVFSSDILAETQGLYLGDTTNRWEVVANSINATLGTGTDNSVVVKNSSNQLVTDEIDSRVWGSSLVDGSGTATYMAYWSDANTITGEAGFTYNASTNILTVNEVSATNLTIWR